MSAHLSTTGTVYRVSYRRPLNGPAGRWKYKLYNSEAGARRFIENLQRPVTADTPKQYRGLPPFETSLAFMSGVFTQINELPIVGAPTLTLLDLTTLDDNALSNYAGEHAEGSPEYARVIEEMVRRG